MHSKEPPRRGTHRVHHRRPRHSPLKSSAVSFNPDQVASEHPQALEVAGEVFQGAQRLAADLQNGTLTLDNIDSSNWWDGDPGLKESAAETQNKIDNLSPAEKNVTETLVRTVTTDIRAKNRAEDIRALNGISSKQDASGGKLANPRVGPGFKP
jgi:hypothetical protein